MALATSAHAAKGHLIMAEIILSEPELQKLCLDYQKLLRIQDWDITVRLVNQDDIPGKDGDVMWNNATRKATIRIPAHDTWAIGFSYKEQNMRLVLLHELVHVVFGTTDPMFNPDDIRHDLWESSIWSVAEALENLLTDLNTNIIDSGMEMDDQPAEGRPRLV